MTPYRKHVRINELASKSYHPCHCRHRPLEDAEHTKASKLGFHIEKVAETTITAIVVARVAESRVAQGKVAESS